MRLLCVLLNSLITLAAVAQRTIDATEQWQPWLTANNVAALQVYTDSSTSEAYLSSSYEGGSLRNYNDANDKWSIMAGAKSYYRLTPDIMTSGSISLREEWMSCDGVSTLGGDALQPFDLINEEGETRGRSHREEFRMTGRAAWQALRQLSIGAGIDFSAGNYAKYRDLRHTDRMMRLNAELGIFIPLGASAAYNKKGIGASMLYRRSTDGITFSTYGTTDRIYSTLINYANFIGETETFATTDGFTTKNNEQPLLNEQTGVSVQAALPLNIFFDFCFMHRTGHYGKQSQYTAYYASHSGNRYQWHVRLMLPQMRNDAQHYIDFRLDSEGLTTQRTNYRQVRSTEGTALTYYEYYAPTRVADKLLHQGHIMYALHTDRTELSAGAHFSYRQQTAYMLPTVYTQKLRTWQPFIAGEHQFSLHCGRSLSTRLSTTLNLGSGNAADHPMAQAEREYLTSTQLLTAAMLRYEFPVKGLASIRPSISLHYALQQQLEHTKYIGQARHNIALAAGVRF